MGNYKWDLLQDTQGQIALFSAWLEGDVIYAEASLSDSFVEDDSTYVFVCPEFRALVQPNGCIPRGCLYIREKGDRLLEIPVQWVKRYDTYMDYLVENVEGSARRKSEKKQFQYRKARDLALNREVEDV